MIEKRLDPIQSFKETIYDNALDMGIDFTEIGLDMFLNDGAIKDIPFFGTICKIGTITASIRDIIFVKKVLVFAQQVQKGNIEKNCLQRHKEKLKNNEKKLAKELEVILDYLERQTGYIKAKILAKFYFLYLSEELSWSDFGIIADIIDSVSMYDFDMLKDLYEKKEYTQGMSFDRAAAKRLDRCSLIDYFNGMAVSDNENTSKWILARINHLGEVFYEVGLKDENYGCL